MEIETEIDLETVTANTTGQSTRNRDRTEKLRQCGKREETTTKTTHEAGAETAAGNTQK